MTNQTQKDFYRIENVRSRLSQAERELRAVLENNPVLEDAYATTLEALAHISDVQHSDALHNGANLLSLDHLRDDLAME